MRTRGDVELRRNVPLTKWISPAHEEAVHASGDTPLGRVTLTRRPGNRSHAEAAADAWEDWELALAGEHKLKAFGLAAPGYASQRRLRTGIAADLDGETCHVTVSSAFLWSNRSARLRGPTVDLAFTTRGLGIDLRERGEPLGARRAGHWNFTTPTASTILAACLFEWAAMDHFLHTPGLRLLGLASIASFGG